MYGEYDQVGEVHQDRDHIHVFGEIVKIFGQFGLTIISDSEKERERYTYKGTENQGEQREEGGEQGLITGD